MSASSGYFWGREGGGGRQSADAALLGQEGSGIRLQKGIDNQHVVGGEGGVWQGAGVRGGTSFATAAVVNDNPCTSRSAAAVFFTRMDVWGSGAKEEVAATGSSSNDGRGGDDVALAATRVGVGWRNKSRRGKEENAVTMAAGMGGGAVDDLTTGGWTATEVRGARRRRIIILQLI